MEISKEKILEKALELASILEIPQSEIEKIKENLNFCYCVPEITKETAAQAIDHTVLSFNAGRNDVLRICEETKKYGFKAVCINPVWVKTAANFRHENNAAFKIATVIDFPLGASTAAAKQAESAAAALDGADEIDVVINIGLIKSGMFRECFEILKSTIQIDLEECALLLFRGLAGPGICSHCLQNMPVLCWPPDILRPSSHHTVLDRAH